MDHSSRSEAAGGSLDGSGEAIPKHHERLSVRVAPAGDIGCEGLAVGLRRLFPAHQKEEDRDDGRPSSGSIGFCILTGLTAGAAAPARDR